MIKNRVTKDNKLFLVCPFCQMEDFIRNHFGDVFFLTACAAMFEFEEDFVDAVKGLINRKQIKEIYFVGEISCNFTKNVLNNENYSGLKCESEIQELYSPDDTLHSLTVKMMKLQSYKLQDDDELRKEIQANNVLVHMLITDKQNNKIFQVK